jgi:hypothetical protein
VAQLIMVEGLPGSGKSTTAHFLSEWLADRRHPVAHFSEGRTDHPVDAEQVAVLSTETFIGLVGDFPAQGDDLIRGAEKVGDSWLVRYGQRRGWPCELRARLAEHDVHDGTVTPELYRQVLRESWDAFGDKAAHGGELYLLECVLLQNPLSALMARFDEPRHVVEGHVRALAESVTPLNPALVYLDPGDPTAALERIAAERPEEWLESVIAYHCGQGHGLAHGLAGFDGYVEFMRRRREVELDLLPSLGVPTLHVEVGDGDWETHRSRITAFVGSHLDASTTGLALGA